MVRLVEVLVVFYRARRFFLVGRVGERGKVVWVAFRWDSRGVRVVGIAVISRWEGRRE